MNEKNLDSSARTALALLTASCTLEADDEAGRLAVLDALDLRSPADFADLVDGQQHLLALMVLNLAAAINCSEDQVLEELGLLLNERTQDA